jgi:hypothetical protein
VRGRRPDIFVRARGGEGRVAKRMESMSTAAVQRAMQVPLCVLHAVAGGAGSSPCWRGLGSLGRRLVAEALVCFRTRRAVRRALLVTACGHGVILSAY